MYWGHAVSDNLVDWTYLPVALARELRFSRTGGCFSELPSNMMESCISYIQEPAVENMVFCAGTVPGWSSDGITFEKYEEIVLRAPAGYDECDFPTQRPGAMMILFYMICGTKRWLCKLLLFKSADLKNGNYKSVMAEQGNGEKCGVS